MREDRIDKYNYVLRYPPSHRNVDSTMTIISYDIHVHVLQVRTVMANNCSENGELEEGVSKTYLITFQLYALS